MNQRWINLNGEWQLRWDDGERGERLKRVLAGDVDWTRAWPANVPGSVHGTLLELGVIPDPCIGTNVLACRWVEETRWYYRRTFDCARLRKGERAWLCFEALDLAANIFLNGKHVGSHRNVFYPCRIEVTSALKTGSNELLVQIESGLFESASRSLDGYGLPINRTLTKSPWLRKTQSQHGWDWAPRLLNVGIPGGVRMEISTGVRWDSMAVLSAVSDDLQAGHVTARVFAENPDAHPVRAELAVSVDGRPESCRLPVTLQPGMNRLDGTLEIVNPDLWWPVHHGPQTRYAIRAELRIAGKVVGSGERKTGFRKVRINQDPHPEAGRYFVLEVNNKPVFCKGANYVPTDLILSRVRRGHHEALINLALDANFNFLRCWGGGVYESDDFYDLCDERGIMVWQDFIYACSKYPFTDEAFLADATREATHQVRRLAHHPSLVVWCGNNEIEWAHWDWGFDKGVTYPDHAFFHLVLPRLLKNEDPARLYLPSSPFSPDHEKPNADHLGDQHAWGVGFGETDFRKYRDMICRFPNEGGLLGPNCLPAVRESLAGGPEKPGTFAWELHDCSLSAWDQIPAYSPDRMLEHWLGRPLARMGIEDYVYWAGVLQGAGLDEYIKNFRRRMFDSAAAVFWMFNDIWPCTRSWAVVDYRSRRAPSFWPVRRAFAPVTVVVSREGKTVRVHGINDGPEITATLRFGILALAGAYPSDTTLAVTLPANASTVIAEFPAAKWDRLGVRAHVAFAILGDNGRELARDALILPLFREMRWPEAGVKITCAGGRATFTSKTFAWRVCLDLDGGSALPDNFFDVFPGIPTVLPWHRSLGRPRILRIGNPLGATQE
jgi:beta-mannosidase